MLAVARLALFLFAFQSAPAPRTVFVVDKVIESAEAHKVFGGVSASAGEHHTAPKVMAEFQKKCHSIAFTQDRTAAEFVLETQSGGSTLTDAKGNVLYVSPAKKLSNMTKDVCAYVSVH